VRDRVENIVDVHEVCLPGFPDERWKCRRANWRERDAPPPVEKVQSRDPDYAAVGLMGKRSG
jgi:hypothetical protein